MVKKRKIELTVTDELKLEVFDHFSKGICRRKNCKKSKLPLFDVFVYFRTLLLKNNIGTFFTKGMV